jgi:uncharacterized protein (TIGR02145 family)
MLQNNNNLTLQINQLKIMIMKKHVSFFVQTQAIAFLLFSLLGMGRLSAQVTVSNMKANYPAKQISFTVTWATPAYNNQIWVIVDYIKVEGVSTAGSWSRALVTEAAATSAGSVTASTVTGNRGFWLNASGSSGSSGSAHVTATLSLAADKFNWCAYALDLPPNATPKTGGGYDLHGTTPFTINGTPLAQNSTTYHATITSITDPTDNPNGFVAKQTEPGSSCALPSFPFAGIFSDFPAAYSASTAVSLMDKRDGKIYNAVKIGDRWWMAQNLNYQEGLTYFDKHSLPNSTTGSNPALRGGFWCPADNSNSTPVAVCDYWGALYAWETAMMLDGKGTWTEVSGSYCTGAANSANCKVNHGRKASSGTAIGGRGICPPNWHVPTDFELGVLFDALESGGGTTHQTTSDNGVYVGIDAGTRGKASCQGNSGNYNPTWDSGAGTDVFNFRGLAGDNRNEFATNDGYRGEASIMRSSAAYSGNLAWGHNFENHTPRVYRLAFDRSSGTSIRCVRN